MQKHILWLTLIIVLLLAGCNLQSQQTAALSSISRDTCPVTQPPDPSFTPPSPYPEWPDEGMFWIGDANLWTAVPLDATWVQLPHDEDGYSQKLFWWSQNYAGEAMPALTVTGQQLNGEATIETDQATNGSHATYKSFMLTGITVPTAGCWQFTANYADHDLSFVVWIES